MCADAIRKTGGVRLRAVIEGIRGTPYIQHMLPPVYRSRRV